MRLTNDYAVCAAANPAQGSGGIGLLLTWLFDYVSGKMHHETESRGLEARENGEESQTLAP